MIIAILIILILLGFGTTPWWGYSRGWGYGPSGIIGVVLVVLIVMWAFGGIPTGP